MQEKRRSQRASFDVVIQLVSMQLGGRSAVAQNARAVDVSKHGALLECRSKFEIGAEMMVHNPRNLQNGLFKVVRAVVAPSGGWLIGIELQDPDPTFWGA